MGVHSDMEHAQRKLVLHQIFLIPLLHRLGYHVASYKPSVYKIDLKVAVGSDLHRLSQIALHADPLLFCLYGNQLSGYVPSVDAVDHLPQIPVAGGVELHLPSHRKLKGNIRS